MAERSKSAVGLEFWVVTNHGLRVGVRTRVITASFAAIAALTIPVFTTSPAHAAEKNCDRTSTGLVPLTDMASQLYLGHEGGLYAGGTNELPAQHQQLGLDLSDDVVPRNQEGHPAKDGLIGLLSVGVSNTHSEFAAFEDILATDPTVSASVVPMNGAQGSRALEDWAAGIQARPWQELEDVLHKYRISPAQIQVAWVKLPSMARGTVSLKDSGPEMEQLIKVLQQLFETYPNLRLGYVSSRIYAGYALRSEERSEVRSGAEPKAYQHGFTIKTLIDLQINGDPRLNADGSKGVIRTPWISWGPYLWADGLIGRGDGLVWECDDLAADGIHPSEAGAAKVAGLLLQHFSTDPTAASWFLRGSEQSSMPQVSSGTEMALPSTSKAMPIVPLVTEPQTTDRQGVILAGVIAAVIGVVLLTILGILPRKTSSAPSQTTSSSRSIR